MHGVDRGGGVGLNTVFFKVLLLFYNSLAYETDNQQNTADNGIKVTETLIETMAPKVTETLIETMASNLASMEPDERQKMVRKSIFHAAVKILIT